MKIQDLINTVISKKIYKSKEEIIAKLDVFLLMNRITTEDYEGFVKKVNEE